MPKEKTKEGYIIDYVSGQEIKATPEEIEATQVFSQKLVEEYEYDRNQIQTRPQYYVRKTPSDELKEYPIDIGIFNGNSRTDRGNELILPEGKNRCQILNSE